MLQAGNLLGDLSDFKDANALLAETKDVDIIAEAVGEYVVALTVIIA